MPTIGDIKRGSEIGRKACATRYIWCACVGCGRERWVQLLGDKPVKVWCKSCAHLGKHYGQGRSGEVKNKGYVYIYKPEHPRAGLWGYVKRAILVLEEGLGRYLLDGCVSHHINEIKDDDRLENLIELRDGTHRALHNMLRVDRIKRRLME